MCAALVRSVAENEVIAALRESISGHADTRPLARFGSTPPFE
jgi:hypothetical protein